MSLILCQGCNLFLPFSFFFLFFFWSLTQENLTSNIVALLLVLEYVMEYESSNRTLKTEKEHDKYRRGNVAGQTPSSNCTSVHENNEKNPKSSNSSNFFQHLKKWIISINFIHDIDHTVTNFNKTSWNSVPDPKVFFCLDNLWYLFLLQVKEYHEDYPWKTKNLGGFQQKISFRQLRHMTIIFEKKESAWLAHTVLDSIFRIKTFKWKKSTRGDFMRYFWMQSIYLQSLIWEM